MGTSLGVYRRAMSEITTAVTPLFAAVPDQFTLHQNYPNPFNPGTTIRYELPRTSMVKLGVFDVLGRVVSVPVNERKNAGSHEVKFDAAGYSSGVYFYRMQAGDFEQVKKLTVVR